MTETTNTRRSDPGVAPVHAYAEAQRLVDGLSDAGFPVQHVRIVGDGLHSVER